MSKKPFDRSSFPDDAVGVRARAMSERLLARPFTRRFVPLEDLDDWEGEGWVRTGAVRPGPFGSELFEITLETDNDE